MTSFQSFTLLVILLGLLFQIESVSAFSSRARNAFLGSNRVSSSLSSSSSDNTAATTSNGTSGSTTNDLYIPLSFNEMIKQASRSMSDAYEQGITRQMVRVLLPRDPGNAQLGRYFEEDASIDPNTLVLAPPDETWQGGIMQLYRAAAPTCAEILRRVSKSQGGVPPKLVEDRSVDESGVDGIGLWMSQSTTPADDVSCFVQPTQEIIGAVEQISQQAGGRLVALLNPQWRFADDALDTASKEGGVLGTLASFLGGKGNSLKRLEEMGFQYTYVLEGYVCKGGNVRLIKRFDSNWVVFAENDSATDYIRVGDMAERPKYQDVEKMLDDKGISLKYARDIGLAPKL